MQMYDKEREAIFIPQDVSLAVV